MTKKEIFPRRTVEARRRVTTAVGEKSLTKQSFAKEVDVNSIIQRHRKGGIATHVRQGEPRYGFAEASSFHEIQNARCAFESEFEQLPEELREKYGSAGELLEAMGDPDRRAELVEDGIFDETEGDVGDASDETAEGLSEPPAVVLDEVEDEDAPER